MYLCTRCGTNVGGVVQADNLFVANCLQPYCSVLGKGISVLGACQVCYGPDGMPHAASAIRPALATRMPYLCVGPFCNFRM